MTSSALDKLTVQLFFRPYGGSAASGADEETLHNLVRNRCKPSKSAGTVAGGTGMHILPRTATQSDVWSGIEGAARQAIDNGKSVTCLLYGPTGTGKTYTALGPSDWERQPFVNWGLIPRAISMFLGVSRKHLGLFVEMEAVFIRGKELTDCSAPRTGPSQGAEHGVRSILEKTTHGLLVRIRDIAHGLELIRNVQDLREAAPTALNPSGSSRNHMIISLILCASGAQESSKRVISRIAIADLAGSEGQHTVPAWGEGNEDRVKLLNQQGAAIRKECRHLASVLADSDTLLWFGTLSLTPTQNAANIATAQFGVSLLTFRPVRQKRKAFTLAEVIDDQPGGWPPSVATQSGKRALIERQAEIEQLRSKVQRLEDQNAILECAETFGHGRSIAKRTRTKMETVPLATGPGQHGPCRTCMDEGRGKVCLGCAEKMVKEISEVS
ncbi:hypothetical protein IAR55_007208 [Kwoniella newhampshirensis]|uniref:Kinesin motor domain-containing protein n=1 Tax=Kwoniella newhampshirensis TaxID=1651941 RepID=A0AAW0YPW1_9TREE